MLLNRGPCAGRPMSTGSASKLESLILEKICSLDYVSRAGYVDDGREVTVLVIHDDNPDRDTEMFLEVGRRGRYVEDGTPDRMISPLAIQDGPDLPEGILAGTKVIYEREARQ